MKAGDVDGLEVTPDLEGFAAAARRGNVVPVTCERLADLLTPVSAYLKIAGGLRRPFLLESAEGGEHIGRYSYLGGDPFLEIEGDAEGLWLLHDGDPGSRERLEGDPVQRLSALQARFRGASRSGMPGVPPFSGGAVGYVGYDAARWVERIPATASDDIGLPWVWLGLYDTVLAFDHLRHRLVLVANGHVDDPDDRAAVRRAYAAARERLERLAELLDDAGGTPAPLDVMTAAPRLQTEESLGESEFCAAVERAQEHIAAGDAFQIVLSRRLSCALDAEPITVYRALRAINPSPYMFCLDSGRAHVVGSSPEMLVRVQDGEVETRPIAGTRPRGGGPEEDAELEEQLLADDKELAEHLMLVDLGRNDVGRVAAYGSVEVPDFMIVERYSHVMHIVSSVRGRLRQGVSAVEALFASFPAGTVSGAPKIRAMQIIDELEPVARGIYAGAVLYSDFAGNLNSCITIRTLVMADGVAHVQAGAGIVADSVPQREYRETEQKAAAALQAVTWACDAVRRQGRPVGPDDHRGGSGDQPERSRTPSDDSRKQAGGAP